MIKEKLMKNLYKKEKLVLIIAILMIIFGLAEVITGFRHEFFGLVTSEENFTTIVGVILGLSYFFAGITLLIYKRWSLNITIVLLLIDISGRLLMMITGMYPMDSVFQASGIIIGTLIATSFLVIVVLKRRKLKT